MTQVVVTGGTGYLGSQVANLLERLGVESVTVGRSDRADVRCNLLDCDACAALVSSYRDAVFVHCAAVVPSNAQDYADAAAAEESLTMVRNLSDARPRRTVFLSSMTVYRTGIGCAREEDAHDPESGYAWGKLQAEQLLLDRLPGRTNILRIPGLFGPPRRDGLLYRVARSFATNHTPDIAETLPQWAAVHVEDAAEICVRAALRPYIPAAILNAGYPGPMSIPDAVSRLARIFGREVKVPTAVSFSFDLSRLHAALGPLQGDFQSRLEELAAWVQSEVAVEQ